jgi:hypothetical protein
MLQLPRVLLACSISPSSASCCSGDHQFQGLEVSLENFGLREQLFAVGDQNVAPDFGVAGRDAGEVAKAGARQRQVVLALGLAGNGIHQRKSNQMGQVADGGKRCVVLFRRHFEHPAAQSRPYIDRFLELGG